MSNVGHGKQCVYKENGMSKFSKKKKKKKKPTQNFPFKKYFYNMLTQKGQDYLTLSSQEVSDEKVVSNT